MMKEKTNKNEMIRIITFKDEFGDKYTVAVWDHGNGPFGTLNRNNRVYGRNLTEQEVVLMVKVKDDKKLKDYFEVNK